MQEEYLDVGTEAAGQVMCRRIQHMCHGIIYNVGDDTGRILYRNQDSR